MNANEIFIAYKTIVIREVLRFMRIWMQTVLPPMITTALYFVIFGHLIGNRIGEMDGYSYMEFMVPGLIMMSIITNSYANVVSSVYGAKFQHHIEEMLVSPMPNWVMLLGFITGGMARGLVVGLAVSVVALFFAPLHIHNFFVIALVFMLTSGLFALGGFLNGIFANSFDHISIVPTFVLTPLTYLGGVFYSIHMLPEIWQKVSLANPILYMINAFRYGILGQSDIKLWVSLLVLIAFSGGLFTASLWFLKRGYGVRQ
ncbi:MAG: ABC transporter permease [Gammaproteobacteria bacterium]